MIKVFLGGTTNSKWRKKLIPRLEVGYFNPIFDEWNKNIAEEIKLEQEKCDFYLCVITPKMKNYENVAKVVESSCKYPQKTIFCILQEDEGCKFEKFQTKSLNAVGKLIKKNGAYWFNSLDKVVTFLNKRNKLRFRVASAMLHLFIQ